MIYKPVSYYPSEGEVGYNTDDFHSLDPEALSVLNWINTHNRYSMDYDEEDSVSPIEVEGGSKEEDSYKVITPDMIGFMGGMPIVASAMDHVTSKGELAFEENYKEAFGSKDNMYTFFSRLAKNESGYNPTIRNKAGAPAWGYFQFMEDGKKWNNITRYAGVSKDEFLRNPVLQIQAAKRLANSFMSQLTPEDRAKAKEKGITDSGLLGGMWLGGYGGLKRYLYNNENISDKHWSNTGAGIDMKNQIARYNGLFKKGGKVFKGNTGMVFVNESGDKSRPSVVAGVYDRNVGYDRNRETLDFIRRTNGSIRYDKKKGVVTPEFWDRLRETSPRSVSGIDGEPMNVLMSYGEVDGKYVVYPEIQEIDGRLVRLEGDEAIDKALSSGNYVVAPNEGVARDFTKNYKAYTEHFPAFKDVKKSFTPWRTDWDSVMRDINNSGSKIKSVDNRPSSNTLSLYGDKANEAIRIYKKLINDGYDPAQSAGLVGVFMQESSLDHSKVSDAGAKGIGQLKDAKLNKYYEWLKETGRPDNSDSQIDWIMDHVNYGNDDWRDYYDSLMENSRDDFARVPEKDREKNRKDWALMENSKYADYDYESFRDTFYNMSLSPGEVAELFTWTFERPGEDEANIEQRKRYAEQLYYYMNPHD